MINENHMLKISLLVEDKKTKEECPPNDIVAILDISGSMDDSAAGVNDGSTVFLDLGYSKLDLVKHSTKTIISTMRP